MSSDQSNVKKVFISFSKNEVTWGILITIGCAISLIIIWVGNKPLQWQKYKDPAHEQVLLAIVGGIFAFVASMMSFVQIVQHFLNKTHHQSQKRIMRILAMVPLYAITSWISLLFHISAIYMEFIKSCFEAYIIYSFLLLLTKYLGGHRGVEQVIISQDHIHLPFPCCFIKPRPDPRWVGYFKMGLLQYTWINPICSAVAVVLNLAEIYGNGKWNFRQGFPYIIVIINISQTLALYSLVAFYANTKESLKPFRPLPKFIVIKLIVFFIFWQTVIISGLASLKILRNSNDNATSAHHSHESTDGFTIEQKKIFLENILICVEMFFFSIGHHWIFDWQPYADGTFKKLMETRHRAMYGYAEDH